MVVRLSWRHRNRMAICGFGPCESLRKKMRDILTYTFNKGYFDNGTVVEVPDGSMLPPSVNVLFDKNGRLMSFKGLLTNPQLSKSDGSVTTGGTRAFLLDRDTVGFLGKITTAGGTSTVNKANGNMIQSIGRSLWFVGNTLTNAVRAVKLESPGYSELSLGATLQNSMLPIYVATTVTTGGVVRVKIEELNFTTGAVLAGVSPIYVNSTLATSDTMLASRDKIYNSLRSSSAVADLFYFTKVDGLYSAQLAIDGNGNGTGATVSANWIRFLAKIPGKRYKITLEKQAVVGISDSVDYTGRPNPDGIGLGLLPALDYEADLSVIPHFSKWTGTGWSTPTRVGLPEVESEREEGSIGLFYDTGSSGSFVGLVQGSRSVRVARKRLGGISIASAPSNIVTVPEQGGRLRVLIPIIESDDISVVQDTSWLLYFTYKGLGSTATHKLFPLEITEAELRGLVNTDIRFLGNAKYQVTKAGTVEDDREVTVEFTDADLLAIDPLDDAFPAEECKFIAKLGNVMCLIGTGDDQTGFDVSIPNNFEGYNPEWRDWLSEVPVSIAVEQDLGFFWILTANNVHMAEWTGVTEGAAPVVLRKVSSVYGAIGEGASVCVNGMLYFLTRGKTPVVISPQGQVNAQIGAAVQNYFTGTTNGAENFDSTTQVSWDENTNSVVFSCNGRAIALQLSAGLWSAPIDTSGTIYSMVPINGYLNVCKQNTDKFRTSIWNSMTLGDKTPKPWLVTSNFQFGKSGRALKDIIQVESIISSPTIGVPIKFAAFKNFDTYPFQIPYVSYNTVSRFFNLASPTDKLQTGTKVWITGATGGEIQGPYYVKVQGAALDLGTFAEPSYINLDLGSFQGPINLPLDFGTFSAPTLFGNFTDTFSLTAQPGVGADLAFTMSGSPKFVLLSQSNELVQTTINSQSPMISVREYTESLDYDCIAASVQGYIGGQSIHSVMYTVQVHNIERQK